MRGVVQRVGIVGRWALVGAGAGGMLACGAVERGARSTDAEPGKPSAPRQTEGDEAVNSGTSSAATPAAAPALEAGRYVFRMGELELEVDPAIGGRVTRFSLAGENILTGPEVVAGGEGSLPNMYGSTFWTSPQSAWGWPPEVAIDTASHRSELVGDVLELASDPGAITGYAVRKRFRTDAARGVLSIEYILENQRATSPAAPWEISRVPKEGLVLFAASAPALAQSSLPSTLRDGVAWIDIALAPASDSKLFQDGSEGWLAYIYRDLAFIKAFEDLHADQAAPGEAEIEIFASGNYDYVEIEQQGRYAMPSAGGRASWQVHWLLRRVPADIDASLGSEALVAWVRSQVAAAR
jgi:hypothetical protein